MAHRYVREVKQTVQENATRTSPARRGPSEGTTTSRRWVWGLPCGPDGGCEITEGTYINGGRNTKGGRALRSEGRRDCARRCRDDSTCKAWTMRLENNLCWLKTTSEGTTPNKNWVWGLPC